jgi:hypothetical protein
MAVLDEAVDQRGDARRARKDRAPLLERQVRRQHERAALVPAADEVVEQIGGLTAARQVADFVQNQQRRGRVLPKPSLEGRQRLLLEQIREGGG